MSTTPPPGLSKTRYVAGLQCLKRLHLEVFSPALADPRGDSLQARLSLGTHIGELARRRFPGGVLVDYRAGGHRSAAAQTAAAIADPGVPAIYEAAFTYQDIRFRSDVLARNDDGSFDLVEVKSAASAKDDYLPDVAVQLYGLEGCGVTIRRALLLHINKSYVYQGGDYDLQELFVPADVTDKVRRHVADILPKALTDMRGALSSSEPPSIAIGPQCNKPYPCPFYGLCHQHLPADYVGMLPNVRGHLLDNLVQAGILSIADIPEEYPDLSPRQRIVRDAIAKGVPFVGEGLSQALQQLEYPLHALDFEAANPPLPLYSGTSPFQILPFQWSLHLQNGGGLWEPRAYLHPGDDDPREAVAVRLLESVQPHGSILVYSPYEKARLRELALYLPHYASDLTALSERLVDLLAILREHYYHPGFGSSYSLKSVAPVLAPSVSYAQMDIQDGQMAALAYARIASPQTPDQERQELRQWLLDYCKLDTLAMVRVLEALQLAANSRV